MKPTTGYPTPPDASRRSAAPVVICYPPEAIPPLDTMVVTAARDSMIKVDEVVVPPREAATFEVPGGGVFRILSVEGPQVGDLNLFHAHDLTERFWSGKTRAMHGTHVSTGDRVWSTVPHLRPLATITDDTLDWYGYDADGGGVHDVIGTRCDPYTQHLLTGADYHHCCHSNLTRAVARHTGRPEREVEPLIHDVMNVFMCTGFTHDTHQYFMKASPVRPGDYLEFLAEVDLLGALSACPGGDCGDEHSSDVAACHPLVVEVYETSQVDEWEPAPTSGYRWPT
ncbi:MAG: DUF1989 domain-containing protein [Actinomycetota bacterium]|nr:DUF1989 domain-containing protein [Actinomycetota bacterium]